jgi:hypothetical protein
MEHIFNIVNSMCLDNRFSVPSIPRLTLWFLQFSAFLQKLLETTKALESNSSTIDNVLIAMDYILSLFEEGKEQYKDDEIMASCFNAGLSGEPIRRIDCIDKTNTEDPRGCKGHRGLYTKGGSC